MSYFVYVHTSPSGKRYVGLTTKENPDDRWECGHGYRHNQHFNSAIKKYGWDCISHQVYEVDTDLEMRYLERYLISYYQTRDSRYGYNTLPGGEVNHGENNPMYGKHHSEETISKIKGVLSDILSGENNPMYGKHHSKETCDKISALNTGKFVGKNNPMYGKHHSEETKRKIREKTTGFHHSDETIKRMCETRKGENNANYGNRGENNPLSIPICQYTKSGEFIRGWASATVASKELNLDSASITRCCRGQRYKSVGGYVWKYKEK